MLYKRNCTFKKAMKVISFFRVIARSNEGCDVAI